MPVEPISIISITAGFISFLVATIPRLDQLRRDYKDSDSKLSWYESQLITIRSSLTTWEQLWSNAKTNDDLNYLWGFEGHRTIRQKTFLIHLEVNAIGDLLFERPRDRRRPEAINGNDWKRWRGQCEGRSGDTKAKALWQKLVFAFFKDADLEQRTNRLRNKVDDLKLYSENLLWNARFLSDDMAVTDTTVRRILDRRRCVEDYSAVLTQLHSLTTQWSWSLVLSRPDSEGGPESIDGDPMLLIFDAIKQRELQGPLGIIDFYLSELEAQDLRDWLHQKSLEDHVIPQRRDDLYIRISNPPISDMHWRVTLAELAIGLVNWTLLLWETPWTNTICICRIRFVTLSGISGRNVALPTLACQGNCLKGTSNHTDRKVLALAVCLAELALQQVVEVNTAHSATPEFVLGGTSLSKEKLLQQVKSKAGPPYMYAVRYCFDYDDKMNPTEFRADHILQFKEEVLDRIERIHGASKEHAEFIAQT